MIIKNNIFAIVNETSNIFYLVTESYKIFQFYWKTFSSASSVYINSNAHEQGLASSGRLNKPRDLNGDVGGWTAKVNDHDPYLEVKLFIIFKYRR